jgi:hypothetical protein
MDLQLTLSMQCSFVLCVLHVLPISSALNDHQLCKKKWRFCLSARCKWESGGRIRKFWLQHYCAQAGSETTHPVSWQQLWERLSLGINQTQRETDKSPPFCAEVDKVRSNISVVASSSDNDVSRYVIVRRLLDSIFNTWCEPRSVY